MNGWCRYSSGYADGASVRTWVHTRLPRVTDVVLALAYSEECSAIPEKLKSLVFEEKNPTY